MNVVFIKHTDLEFKELRLTWQSPAVC